MKDTEKFDRVNRYRQVEKTSLKKCFKSGKMFFFLLRYRLITEGYINDINKYLFSDPTKYLNILFTLQTFVKINNFISNQLGFFYLGKKNGHSLCVSYKIVIFNDKN